MKDPTKGRYAAKSEDLVLMPIKKTTVKKATVMKVIKMAAKKTATMTKAIEKKLISI